MDCLSLWIDYEQIIYMQGTQDLDLHATVNTSKLSVMQKMLSQNANKVSCMEYDRYNEKLESY